MKYSFLLILFCLITITGTAQDSFSDQYNYLAKYRLTYQPDSTDVNSQKSEEMLLYLGKESSKFSSSGKAMKEHFLKNRNKSNRTATEFSRFQNQLPQTDFHYTILKHYPSARQIYTESVAMDKFRFSEELDLFDWEIKEEQKKIAGYQVQKAIANFRGRNYIAWFAPEIPISDGPYKFSGLPGLIVQVGDIKQHYLFELTQFGAMETPEEVNFNSRDYIATNKNKFTEVKENYKRDPIAAMERKGIKLKFQADHREQLHRQHLKQLKKENNPIELER